MWPSLSIVFTPIPLTPSMMEAPLLQLCFFQRLTRAVSGCFVYVIGVGIFPFNEDPHHFLMAFPSSLEWPSTFVSHYILTDALP